MNREVVSEMNIDDYSSSSWDKMEKIQDNRAFVKIAFDNAFGALRNAGLSERAQINLLIKILEETRNRDDVLYEAIESFQIGDNYSGSGC